MGSRDTNNLRTAPNGADKGWLQLYFLPERTRISYFALLATTTCAALPKESRMQIIEATGLDRKSGAAQWRDLRFNGLRMEMFYYCGKSNPVMTLTLPR